MKVFNFLIYSLIIIACQSKESIPENKERVKYFKSAYGYVIADYSKKDSFIVSQKTGDNYDTIFRAPSPYIYDVSDVKVFDSNCIFIINSTTVTIDFWAFKKIEKKWKFLGSRRLLMIDLPVSQEIEIINEKNIQVFMQDELVLEYFIDYEKNEFKLIDYCK